MVRLQRLILLDWSDANADQPETSDLPTFKIRARVARWAGELEVSHLDCASALFLLASLQM